MNLLNRKFLALSVFSALILATAGVVFAGSGGGGGNEGNKGSRLGAPTLSSIQPSGRGGEGNKTR